MESKAKALFTIPIEVDNDGVEIGGEGIGRDRTGADRKGMDWTGQERIGIEWNATQSKGTFYNPHEADNDR